jgi:hypothetical protein
LVRVTRRDRIEENLNGLGPLRLDARYAGITWVGTSMLRSLIDIKSQADAVDGARARRLLERVRLRQKNDHLQLAALGRPGSLTELGI